MRSLRFLILGALLLPAHAWAQSSLLQAGPTTQGHTPSYATQGSTGSQAVVQDSGPAGGGGPGLGLSELNITARGTGSPPYIGKGTGPDGEVFCINDAPTTNSTGYHYLCFSANVANGGLINYGAAGTATPQSLIFMVNGVPYTDPAILAFLASNNTWTGIQSFTKSKFVLLGTSTGTLTLNSGNTGASNYTITLPAGTTDFSSTGGTSQVVKQTSSGGAFTVAQLANTDITGLGTASTVNTGTSGATIPLLNGANTWSGVQSFNSGDLSLNGSISGTLLIEPAATAGTHTLTFPAGTTNFSATGGTSQVVMQTSSGAALTVAQLANTDITGLGTASTVNTGTSGATIPLLNGANTWSGATNTFSGMIVTSTGTPSIASGACGATTNGTIVAGSTNQSGGINIGSASTSTCTISFSTTLGSAPKACIIQPENTTAAAVGTTGAYVSAITTGHFVITGTLASSNYFYICL